MNRLDASTVKAHARGRWLDILSHCAPHLAETVVQHPRHVACPVHGGKDGFRLYADAPETGGGVCNSCGSFADGFAVLRWANGWTFPEALEAVAGALGLAPGCRTAPPRATLPPVRPNAPPKPNPAKVARLRRLWKESRPLGAGDPAAHYLETRGLDLAGLAPDVLRTHALDYWTGGTVAGRWPAMLARVVGPTGDPVALHCTYLNSERPGRKAPVPSPRKLWPTHPGATRGAAVRLYPLNGDRLALAEGIETAMAVHLLCGLPCWAAISAGGLGRVELPATVREIFICGDNDQNGTGQGAADRLARRLVAAGRVVRVVMPPTPGDFLDVLQAERREVAA